MKIPSHVHLTEKEAIRMAITALALCFLMEGLAALHFWREKDIWTAGLVIMGWFKEGLARISEKVVESLIAADIK